MPPHCFDFHSYLIIFSLFFFLFSFRSIDSVSIAYFLGPLLGGEVAQYIGFSSLMSLIGVLNIFYGIYLMATVLYIFQQHEYNEKRSPTENKPFSLRLWPINSNSVDASNYKRFYDSVETH